MSAARVLNPIVFSEFCMMRPNPSTVNRTISCGRQLNTVKRDLFGPANPAETNKIFNEELEKHQEKAIKKWGFDFRTGSPLTANSQFIWERVSFQESTIAPEMYTLTRAAHSRPAPAQPNSFDLLLDERAERENFAVNISASTDTDSCDESQDETAVVFKVPVVAGRSNTETTLTVSCGSRQMRKRQPKITEYMKERKRLAQTPKKVAPPAKRMRTNSGSGIGSGSGSSSSSNSFNYITTHNIGAHFATQRHLPSRPNN